VTANPAFDRTGRFILPLYVRQHGVPVNVVVGRLLFQDRYDSSGS